MVLSGRLSVGVGGVGMDLRGGGVGVRGGGRGMLCALGLWTFLELLSPKGLGFWWIDLVGFETLVHRRLEVSSNVCLRFEAW